jgi:hypothetical protein
MNSNRLKNLEAIIDEVRQELSREMSAINRFGTAKEQKQWKQYNRAFKKVCSAYGNVGIAACIIFKANKVGK